MKDLPVKILQQIFNYLPRYNQRICQQVCKYWCESIAVCLINYRELNGYAGVRKANGSLTSTSGSAIHQLKFMMKTRTGAPITVNEFLSLMSKTPNLRVLHFVEVDFVDVDPLFYLTYLEENSVSLHHLEFISIPRSKWINTAHYYFKVAYKYRKSINCLKMELSKRNYEFSPIDRNFHLFLSKFPNLRMLDVYTKDYHHLDLESLLDACPQLEELSIDGPFFAKCSVISHHSKLKENTISRKENKLHSLKVNNREIDRFFIPFISVNLPRLRYLCFYGEESTNNGFFKTFKSFSRNKIKITTLAFQDWEHPPIFDMSQVAKNFKSLAEVNFRDINFKLDERQNVLLDFGIMDLTRVMIDIAPLFESGLTGYVYLQVSLSNNQEISTTDHLYKCTGDHYNCSLFFKVSSNTAKAQEKQRYFQSKDATLVKIKAKSLESVHIYYSLLGFRQNICIDND
jgi:hypothetical protein